MRQWVPEIYKQENGWGRERQRESCISEFPLCFGHFFGFCIMWISLLEWGTHYAVYFDFWFSSIITVFYLFFHFVSFFFSFSPYLILMHLLREEYGNSFTEFFDVKEIWESVRKRNNRFLCHVWMKQFKTQIERVLLSHSFWYSLQTPANLARSRGYNEVADIIDDFQVCFGNLSGSWSTLFNQIYLFLSRILQDYPVKHYYYYYWFDKVLIQDFKDIKEPDGF